MTTSQSKRLFVNYSSVVVPTPSNSPTALNTYRSDTPRIARITRIERFAPIIFVASGLRAARYSRSCGAWDERRPVVSPSLYWARCCTGAGGLGLEQGFDAPRLDVSYRKQCQRLLEEFISSRTVVGKGFVPSPRARLLLVRVWPSIGNDLLCLSTHARQARQFVDILLKARPVFER